MAILETRVASGCGDGWPAGIAAAALRNSVRVNHSPQVALLLAGPVQNGRVLHILYLPSGTFALRLDLLARSTHPLGNVRTGYPFPRTDTVGEVYFRQSDRRRWCVLARFVRFHTESRDRQKQESGNNQLPAVHFTLLPDDAETKSGKIVTTTAPAAILDKCWADVSVLAGLMVDKFAFQLPLYRQHQRLEAAGVT